MCPMIGLGRLLKFALAQGEGEVAGVIAFGVGFLERMMSDKMWFTLETPMETSSARDGDE